MQLSSVCPTSIAHCCLLVLSLLCFQSRNSWGEKAVFVVAVCKEKKVAYGEQ